MITTSNPAPATVRRVRGGLFLSCPECPAWVGNAYTGVLVEGRAILQRQADDHNRYRHATWVTRADDDSGTPTVGLVLGWEDEDRCLVAWGDAALTERGRTENARIEHADELAPRRSASVR